MSILYQSDLCEVVYYPGRSEFTLVTFSNRMMRPDNGTVFWGKALVEKLDIDCIGFVAKGPNWFPAADVSAAIRQTRRQLQKRRLISYGYSMGAYAALKYGWRLGVEFSLSVAPQFSINPDDVPLDDRYRDHFVPELHRDMAITPADRVGEGHRCYVVYDPGYEKDDYNIDLIRACANITGLRVGYMEHDVIESLSNSEIFQEVINSILEGSPSSSVEAILKSQKRRIGRYYRLLGQRCLATKHERWALSLFDRAARHGAARIELDRMLGEYFLQTHDYEMAGRFLQAANTTASQYQGQVPAI
jgi:hypothetical protein